MVNIKPFRGIRYNPEKIPNLSAVISQPHDRINADLQDKYYRLSPYNITRIIKGKAYPEDGETNNIYTRARDVYQAWLREGILFKEQSPALYVTHQTFPLPDGSLRTRRGLIAALEVTPYEEGIVLPHEQILPKSMQDRLNLIKATEANFGSIFMLYSGAGINELLNHVLEQQKPLEFRELFEAEVHQQLWVVTDSDIITAIVKTMANKPNLIIADGHHRYQTAIKYRNKMQAKYPDALAEAGFHYRLVTLVSMDDPGLVILPTHRLIRANNQTSYTEMLERAKEYFEITPVSDRAALEASLDATKRKALPGFGLYDGTYALFTLRSSDILEHLLPHHSPEWQHLDVTIVHELFIERVLGIDKQTVMLKENVEFIRDANIGFQAVAQGEADYLLLMNSTRIEQVQACTTAGERMPQKSTDFYPKMLNGLVAFSVGAEDRV